jgi:hypothetical protein
MSGPPRFTFFCELDKDELQQLFADPRVVETLLRLQASVSLALPDLGPQRAVVVRHLNEVGVPVIAWQLLPRELGYWFNMDNAVQAVTRYRDFRTWTAENHLQWAGVGLDIEPDLFKLGQLFLQDKWRLAALLLGRAFNRERLRRAQAVYSSLVTQIWMDGYHVDSYQFPFIVDERRAGSTLLQRMTGIVDLPVDREILMIYTSFAPAFGPSVLCSYAPEAQSIAVGITGGGVKIEGMGELAALDWEAFTRDLLLAHRWSQDIAIFSLEGCVRQDMLSRLLEFDWSQPIILPSARSIKRVERLRKTLRAVLWASAHPFIVLSSVIVLIWLRSRLRSSQR